MKTTPTSRNTRSAFSSPIARAWRCLPAALLIGQVMAAEVGFVGVLKGQRFIQKDRDFVTLGEWNREAAPNRLETPLAFECIVTGALQSATLQPPAGPPLVLSRESPTDPMLQTAESFPTPRDVENSRPDGTYSFSVVTATGETKIFSLDLTGGNHPPVPQITNHAALQSLASGNPATVQWSPMGGTAQDFVQLSVRDPGDGSVIYQSGMPGAPGALDGTATQTVIPAGTLQPGHSYDAEVLFVRVVDLEFTETLAIAGYSKMTAFNMTAGPPAGAAFQSAIPTDETWGAPRDSAVAFRFSRPMNPGAHAVGWEINHVTTSAFTYQWAEGNTVLLCRPTATLPANAEVEWTLNLSGFQDAAGLPLNGSASGSFHTTADDPVSPPDVDSIYILKQREFVQTGTTPEATGLWDCEIGVDMNAFNLVKSATFSVLANSRSGEMEANLWDCDLYLDGDFASKTDLDRFLANGDFTFALDTLNDGPQSVTLSLGVADAYPDAPVITNLDALQAADPATPVTIAWNALPGWSPEMNVGGGVIELEIDGPGGTEIVWAEGGDLTAGGTAFTVPAGTLWPGRMYHARLRFIRITDLDDASYPGVFAGAGFETITDFDIRTTGTPVMPALTLHPNGAGMDVTAAGGEPDRDYALETSADLSRWLPQTAIRAGQSPVHYWDGDAQFLARRFYRLRDCLEGEEVRPNVAIQGTVWTNSSHSTPVAGAVVGTDLDGRTTVTDAAGRFFLETDTPANYAATPYTITVTSGSQAKSFGPGVWGDQPRGQQFDLQ